MSYEQVKQYFSQNQLSDRVLHFEQSSATVEQAAAAVGCAPCQIAKTLSFRVQGEPVLIVAAGDARIDNPKFKALFHEKARMIPAAEVENAVGHAPGGVCPFALLPGSESIWMSRCGVFRQSIPPPGTPTAPSA